MAENEILNQHTPQLMKYMNTRSALPYLLANQLITIQHWEYLTNTNRTEQECIQYLLTVIPRSGPLSFQKFVKSLSQASEHPGHLYLVTILQKAASSLEQDPPL